MRTLICISPFVSIFSLYSCQQKIDNKIEAVAPKNIQFNNEKNLNFLAALENSSTFSYFTVITAKDLNTGMVKEILY